MIRQATLAAEAIDIAFEIAAMSAVREHFSVCSPDVSWLLLDLKGLLDDAIITEQDSATKRETTCEIVIDSGIS
jgi:hypothetical protein